MRHWLIGICTLLLSILSFGCSDTNGLDDGNTDSSTATGINTGTDSTPDTGMNTSTDSNVSGTDPDYSTEYIDLDSDSKGYVCQKVAVNAEPNPPRVIILQDLSSSLRTYDRWDSLRAAMVQVVDTFNDQFLLGLVPFATTILDGGYNDGDCTVNREHVIQPARGNAEAIKNKVYQIESADLIGGTPTYEALVAAQEILVGNDPGDGSRRVAILVTDGLPNCLDGDGGGASTPEDQERVTNTITQMYSESGMEIYIVGYDMSGSSETLMNTWAANGGTGSYYPAENTEELLAQMATIKSELIPCNYKLEAAIEDPKMVRVQIDGESLPYNHEKGWILGENSLSVTMQTSACQKLRDGADHTVDITVECEEVIVYVE